MRYGSVFKEQNVIVPPHHRGRILLLTPLLFPAVVLRNNTKRTSTRSIKLPQIRNEFLWSFPTREMTTAIVEAVEFQVACDVCPVYRCQCYGNNIKGSGL